MMSIVEEWLLTQQNYFSVIFKRFNSTQEMMDYVRRPDYDTASAPGICAGLSHSQVGEKHVFRLHFNDQQSQDQNNIPNQMNPTTDRFVSLVKQRAFV